MQIAPRIAGPRANVRWRWAYRWLIAFAAFLLILAGLVYWLSLESTLHRAAGWVAEKTQGRLVFEDTHGSLLSRATAARVVWRTEGRVVTSQNVSLRWSPLWLFAGIVALDNFAVDRMIVELTWTQGPHQPPESLKPALRMRIQRAHVAQLDVVQSGGSPTTFRDVGFTAGAGWRDWYFKLTPAQTPWGVLTAEAKIGQQKPFDIDAHLEFRRSAQPVVLAMAAKGPLERIDLNGTLTAQDSALEAKAIATPYADLAFEQVDVNVRAFNPRHFFAAAPEARFSGSVKVAREQNTLQGRLQLANASPGTLDVQRVPITSADAAIHADANSLELADIVVDMGPAGRLAGDARVSGKEVSLKLASDRLDLHAVHAGIQPTRLKGGMGVRGDLAAQDVKVDLAQQSYSVALVAQVSGDAIVVREARATTSGGALRASGRLGLAETHPYELKATLTRFDPSRFGVSRPASLNGSISAEGSISPQVQVRADVRLAPSTLFGLPAQGSARWRSAGVDDVRIAVNGSATVGATTLKANGHVVDPQDLRSLDVQLDLSGADMADLYTIFHVPLPATHPYHIDGRLRFADKVWSFDNFHGSVGSSDLAGTYSVDLRNPRPFVKASLTSERLDITDLSGFIGGGPSAPKVPGKVLPQGEFHLDKLRSADADVTFTGRRFRNERLPLNRMSTHLVLRNGLVTLDPLEFGAAGGRLDGRAVLDARKPTITSQVDMRARDLNLSSLAPGVKALVQSTGKVDARVNLAMEGNSAAKLLGSADGNIVAVMQGGAMSDLVLRLANLDIANSLVAMAKGNQAIPIRCLVADFRAKEGVLVPDPLVLDTEHTLITGNGGVSLAAERFDLRLVAQPKDGSLIALRGPIRVQGPFAQPTVRPELGNAIARTGAAIGLGILAGPAAILPLIEMGKPDNVDCAAHAQQATTFIGQR